MTLPLTKKKLNIKNIAISPPLLLAPMAGLTHSAFRRLISEFGGYGALFTEMLSASALVKEDLHTSTFTRKRPQEKQVFYQLKLNGSEPLDLIFKRLETIEPSGIDINLGCPAPEIKKDKAGTALFEDTARMRKVLESCRKRWKGILTVKCRLGAPAENWEEKFYNRIRLFEEYGMDAVTVHPRFSHEKLKRKARWDLFPSIASQTKLPLIANGDICSKEDIFNLFDESGCSGVMIGRMAVVKPWIFAHACGKPVQVDYQETWEKACSYILEDFPPHKAIGRIKEFGTYFSRNFFFGHQFYAAVQSSSDIKTLLNRADEFLSREPRLAKEPSVVGI
ncbi:MAG: tRNA dihydrouridine synthase [Chitinispirillaceae bacterium]